MRAFGVSILVMAAALAAAPRARAQTEWYQPNDSLLRAKEPGTHFSVLTFLGPGIRTTLEHREPIEQDMSEFDARFQGDVNLGFSDGSIHADLRIASFFVGWSLGIRHVWHSLSFEPDETGLDHGRDRLTRDLRVVKDEEGDFQADTWRWGEARARVAIPSRRFVVISDIAARWEGRPERSFSWEHATVYNGGWHYRSESFVLYRNPRVGFIGPAVRAFYFPRTLASGERTRRPELQYGVFMGTSPQWSTTEHVFLLRLYTSAGLGNELMGIHPFRAPVQFIIGYQVEIDFGEAVK